MDGVVVSAKRAGSTMTHSVVSNAQGEFSFPRDRLEPGKYSSPSARSVRAAEPAGGAGRGDGGSRRRPIEPPSGRRTSSIQLSNGEWLQSFPGTKPFQEALFTCTSCHTLERVAKSRYNAEEMGKVGAAHEHLAQGSMPHSLSRNSAGKSPADVGPGGARANSIEHDQFELRSPRGPIR